MARGEGSGWHRESRRHAEAAMKGRDRGRAHVVQDAKKAGYRKDWTTRPPRTSHATYRKLDRDDAVRRVNNTLSVIDEDIEWYTRNADREPTLVESLELEEYRDGLREAQSDLWFAVNNTKTAEGLQTEVRREYHRAQAAEKRNNTPKRRAKRYVWEQASEAVL